MNGIQVLENVLKNHSVAVYAVDKGQHFARLMVCSGEILEKLNKSLDLKDVPDMVRIISSEEVFKNTELQENYPMYACGISEEKNLSLIVCLYNAGPDQMSLYYLNLFNILCGLMRFSFLRAVEYQHVIEQEKYIPGTLVLYASFFEEILKQQQRLLQNGMANYVLIRFEDKNIEEMDKKLRGIIRLRDVLGCDDKGNLYLILTQMTEENIPIVGERLKKEGIAYTILTGGKL